MLDYTHETNFEDGVVLVDGDILVYRAASLAENLESPQLSYDVVTGMMTRFADDLASEDVSVFFSSSFNVRRYMYPEYKANRKGEKPKYFNEVKKYLKEYYSCYTANGHEADDAIVAEAYASLDTWGDNVRIVTLDKDLRQVPNTTFYNMVTGATEFITKDIAYRNILLQCLTGDRVDNIAGLKGVGKKKAERFVESLTPNSLDEVYYGLRTIYSNLGYTEADLNAVYNCVVMQTDLAHFNYKGIPTPFTADDVKQGRLDEYIYEGRIPNLPSV